MKGLIRFFSNLVVYGFIFCIVILAVFAVFSRKIDSFNYRFFLVQSGSMEPAIMTGDVIFVKYQSRYQINDVITFYEEDKRIVTHRIVSTRNGKFVTKGDANRTEDNSVVDVQNVIGKTVLVVPKIGYLVDFSRTLNGFIFFIIFPGVVLIISQLLHFGK